MSGDGSSAGTADFVGPLDRGGGDALGRRVRDLRASQGLGQEELAATLGVARETLGWLERGKRENPRLRLLADLSQALGVSTSELVEAYVGPIAVPAADAESDQLQDARGAADSNTNLRALGSLAVDGPEGMGVVLRTFRVDLGASLQGAVSRARTHRRYLEAVEAGEVPSPGLLSVTRLAHALDVHHPDLPRTALRVRLLVQVYAGEITAFAAVHEHRRVRRTQ